MMKREECEKQITDLMIQIRDVYKKYNPDGNYIGMFILEDTVHAYNAYCSNKDDADHPLDMYYDIEPREK